MGGRLAGEGTGRQVSLSLGRYGVDGGGERENRIDFAEQLATYYRVNQAEYINLLITSLLGHGRGLRDTSPMINLLSALEALSCRRSSM